MFELAHYRIAFILPMDDNNTGEVTIGILKLTPLLSTRNTA